MDAFIAPIKIRDGNEIKSIRRIDAIYLKQIEAALKGDIRAQKLVIERANEMGLFRPGMDELDRDRLDRLSDAELKQFEALLEKIAK